MHKPFQPSGDTVTLLATTTSSANTLPGSASQVLVQCASGVAFLRFSSAASDATTSDTAIVGPFCKVLTKGGCGHVSVITATGTATVYVTPGEGA